MRDTTLVIMAAGIGSRFAGGIKQLAPVGPSGEIIMDYSIYDALNAGFNKIVFIIRKDLEKDFKEIIGHRIEKIADVSYVYQELDKLPAGFSKPDTRTKPWGTGHAILCCKDVINTPFVVINADDYYGKEAFQKLHRFLTAEDLSSQEKNFCMAGFILGNTLSENGSVTRGICHVDENNQLIDITETHNIFKLADGAGVPNEDGSYTSIDKNTHVSMNMWGFTPELFGSLEKQFKVFLSTLSKDDNKAEFLLPTVVDCMIQEDQTQVSVLETHDKWFGVTYKEDQKYVISSFQELMEAGIYPKNLF